MFIWHYTVFSGAIVEKMAYFANNGARKLKFGLLDGEEDGTFSGIDVVEISEIFAVQDDFSMQQHYLTEYQYHFYNVK